MKQLTQSQYRREIIERFMSEREQREFEMFYQAAKVPRAENLLGGKRDRQVQPEWKDYICDRCGGVYGFDDMNYIEGDAVCNRCLELDEDEELSAGTKALLQGFDNFNKAMEGILREMRRLKKESTK